MVNNNPNIIYQDPVTLIYQDIDQTWYLNDGTPIDDYDPKTGAYQEGGSWYTFQGVELMTYDKATGNYQEPDGTWYTKDGNELNTNKPVAGKALTKTKTSSLKSILPYVIGGVLLVVIMIVVIYSFKKK